MSFDSFQAFLAMGGHGLYVWMVYLAAWGLLAGNFVQMGRSRRKILRELQAQATSAGRSAPGVRKETKHAG